MLAFLVVGSGQGMVIKAMAFILAIGVITLVGRRPVEALMVLLVGVPFHNMLFTTLYRLGAPEQLVRQGVQWKEVLIIGILVEGLRRARAQRHRLDLLDAFALLYVGLGTLYLALPALFAHGEAGESLDLTTRLLGWRTDVLYVALFLACRHLRLRPDEVRRILRAFLITATAVAAIGLFEFFFSATWNRIWIEWIDYPRYKLNIMHADPLVDRQLQTLDIRVYTRVGGRDVLRIGSVILDYNPLASYLLIAVGLLADRIVRGVGSFRVYAALPICGGALLLTQTRSAILAAGIVLVLSLVRRAGHAVAGAGARVRFSLVLGGILVFAVPIGLSVGLVARFNGEDDYSSNQAHADSLSLSYSTLIEHPLGQGLATAAGVGQRANVTDRVITETEPLQIGVQLGFLGLFLWFGFVVLAVVVTGRTASRAPPDQLGGLAGIRTSLIGLLVAGLLLQNFIDFSVTWSLWALVGCTLGTFDTGARPVAGAASQLQLQPFAARR